MSEQPDRQLDNLYCLPQIGRDVERIKDLMYSTESAIGWMKDLLFYNTVLLALIALILLGMVIF